METLYFLKFWKPNASTTITLPSHSVVEEEEEDDSFFDLELSFDVMNKNNESNHFPDVQIPQQTTSKQPSLKSNISPAKTAGESPTLSTSPPDPISKRKILPIEPLSKPQSPIALLKSAPKFGAFIFKKPKSTKKTGETEYRVSTESRKPKNKESGNLFGVKMFSGEETQSPFKLTRENSSRRSESGPRKPVSEDPKTERFSKDVLQKYLNLIKPLYSKVSKRYTDKVKPFGDVPTASPACSPAMPVLSMCSPKKEKQGNFPAGIRVVCKNLGKSKSATTMGVAPPVKRRDDSLLLQHDGIQSAILHCKRSFNSRDSSSLSRSTSDSSSMKSYSTDSSMLSRFASESHDKSARSSVEEGYGAEI